MLWNNNLGKWESPEEKKKREDSVKLEKEKAVNKPTADTVLKSENLRPPQQPQSKQVK